MHEKNQPKLSHRALIFKLVLIAFVIFLLVEYTSAESSNRNFQLNNVAYLYEGNQLVGINEGDKAEQLKASWDNIKEQEKDQLETEDNATLSTKVVKSPSIVDFDISNKKQNETIKYAKAQTKVLEKGYTLTIDNKHKYYIKDEDDIMWVIKEILLAYLPDSSYLEYYQSTGKFKPYTKGNRKYTSIGLENKITIKDGYTSGSEYIDSKQQLMFELFHANQNIQVDTISDEKSISSIIDDHGMTSTQFKINNPDISENSITYNNQSIVVNKLSPVIDVKQTYETEKKETIDFDTVEEEDDTLLEGQTEVKTEGKKGKKLITYNNTEINGKLENTEQIGEEVIQKPVHEVMRVGTKKASNAVTVEDTSSTSSTELEPSNSSSEGFIWPSSSMSVTCEYGCYSGHTGIDIQSYYGGPEYAVADGTVVTAGWSTIGYGYYTVIDHGGGVKTLYAHQKQQPPVSVGQHVTQGQVVGFEGATGNVTGEHLHFEVQINGTAVNPRGYI